MKIKLLGKNLEELKALVAEEGLPGFAAKQIAQWLYVKKVRSIDEMTNLSKSARAALAERYEVGVTPYAGFLLFLINMATAVDVMMMYPSQLRASETCPKTK